MRDVLNDKMKPEGKGISWQKEQHVKWHKGMKYNFLYVGKG